MTARFALGCAVLATICASPLHAAELEGHIALGVNVGDADFDNSGLQGIGRLEYRLTHEGQIGAVGANIVLGGEAWASEPELNETHLLREGFVEFKGAAGSIGFGRQVRVQGVADGFIPTDVVAPRNFRLTRYETEGNRFGLDGIWGTVFLSDSFSLEGYAYDGRRSNVLPSGLYTGGLSLPDDPVESDDAVYGGRLSYLTAAGDIGLSYYSGGAAFPVLVPDAASVRAVVPDLEMLGLDADLVFGPWRVYGEVAYYRYSAGEFGVDVGFLPDDELQSVVGVERELQGDSTLGAQLFHRRLQNKRSPQTGAAAPLADAVRDIYGQFDTTQNGASLTYTWTSDDTRWSAEAAASSWFEGDTYLTLRARYRISDKSALYLNGNWADGPQDTLYGVFSESSNLSLEYRLFF